METMEKREVAELFVQTAHSIKLTSEGSGRSESAIRSWLEDPEFMKAVRDYTVALIQKAKNHTLPANLQKLINLTELNIFDYYDIATLDPGVLVPKDPSKLTRDQMLRVKNVKINQCKKTGRIFSIEYEFYDVIAAVTAANRMLMDLEHKKILPEMIEQQEVDTSQGAKKQVNGFSVQVAQSTNEYGKRLQQDADSETQGLQERPLAKRTRKWEPIE